MLDLFAIAQANAAAIKKHFETAIAGIPPERATLVQEFAAWVETTALIAINVELSILAEILRGRPYQNRYELAVEMEWLSGRPAADILREGLRGYYERRVTFDRSFKGGENFIYGLLYAGGAGLTDYGPYCFVLKRAYQESLAETAYLPGDSLEICFGTDDLFDQDAVQRLAAPHSHMHLMVASQRIAEIPPSDKKDWPKLIAFGKRYFEVIFKGDVCLKTVECVCVLKSEHDRMWDLAFANFGRKLSAAERALVNDFIAVRRAITAGSVKLEVVG